MARSGMGILTVTVIALVLITGAFADEMTDANNPLAGVTSINVQNYYMGRLTGTENQMNNMNLRIAQPFFKGRLLVRATVPVNLLISTSPGTGSAGLGNANVFATYSFISNPGAMIGVGPFLLFPGTNGMGSESWQLGAALVAFFIPSPVFQTGGLVTWQTNVGNPDDTNLITAQPFAFFQLGAGAYIRSSAISTFDLENDVYNIPIGLGFGKVFFGASGNVIYNAFFEPQFSIYSKGDGVPAVQLFLGFNTQFKSKAE